MKVLVDKDVIKEYISGNRSDALNEIVSMCSDKRLDGYIAFHSLNIIWYSIRKQTSEARCREWMKCLCEVLTISGTSNEEVFAAAHNVDFKDFDDNLQECCAVSVGCDYIVTVNVKDYEHSRVPAVTPSELVQIIHSL